MDELTIDSDLPPESEADGNYVEYKIVYNITGPTSELERIEASSITQIQLRLDHGEGRALYFFGVEDNGNKIGIPMPLMLQSLNAFHAVLQKAGGYILDIDMRCVGNSITHIGQRKLTRPFYRDILGLESNIQPERYIACIKVKIK